MRKFKLRHNDIANLGGKKETWSWVASSGCKSDWWSAVGVLTVQGSCSLNADATQSNIAATILVRMVFSVSFFNFYLLMINKTVPFDKLKFN